MPKKFLSFILVISMILALAPFAAVVYAEPDNAYGLEVDLDGSDLSLTKDLRVTDLSGKDSFNLTVTYAAMKANASESAITTVKWTFNQTGVTANAISKSASKSFTTGSGVVNSFVPIVTEGGVTLTGIYTINVTTVTNDGKTGPSAKYRIEVIPDGAVARVFSGGYESNQYGPFNDITRNEYYCVDGSTNTITLAAFKKAFDDAATDCDNYENYTTLIMYDDLTTFTGIKAADWLTVNANGHKIGSLYSTSTSDAGIEGYLPVNGTVDFENLSGLVCLQFTGEYPDIMVKSLSSDFAGLAIDCGGNPSKYLGIIVYCVDYSQDQENGTKLLDASKVVVNESGYTAVDAHYGITLERTTDYPYALLNTNNKFEFFNTITAAKAEYDANPGKYQSEVYVMNYQNLSNTAISRKDYYVTAIPDGTTLKTVIRVTNGMVSDYYTYDSSTTSWKFLYNNMPGASTAHNTWNPASGTNAAIHVLSGSAVVASEGGVDIAKDWAELTEDVTLSAVSAGAFKVSAGAITIDVNSYTSSEAFKQFTLVGCNEAGSGVTFKSNTDLNIIGNGASNVEFDILGGFKTVNVTGGAIVNVGMDELYTGSTLIENFEADGRSQIRARDESLSEKIKIGHLALEDGSLHIYGAVLGGDPSKEVEQVDAETLGTMSALELGVDSVAYISNCKISLDNSSHYAIGLIPLVNKGVTSMYGTEIKVAASASATTCGIFNDGGMLFLEKAYDKTTLNSISVDGTGIISANDNNNAAHLYVSGLECHAHNGIDVQSGTLQLLAGDFYKDPSNKNSVCVYAEDTALKIGAGTEWTIQGENDSLYLHGDKALDAETGKPFSAPKKAMISTGVFDGSVSVANISGIEILKALAPKANYTVTEENGTYKVVNQEYDFRDFIKRDYTNPQGVVYKLPCDIALSDYWSIYHGLYDWGPESEMLLVGQGKHIVDLNGYDIYSNTIEDLAVICVTDGAILQTINTAAKDSSFASANTDSIIAVEGGTYINGASDKKAVNMLSQSEDSLTIMQALGRVDLYGGKYEANVDVVFGEMNIYGGEYHGVMEMNLGAENTLQIYGGKFYRGGVSMRGETPAIVSVALLGNSRNMTPVGINDTTSVIPSGYTIKPYNGTMKIYNAADSEGMFCMATVSDANTYLVVSPVSGGGGYGGGGSSAAVKPTTPAAVTSLRFTDVAVGAFYTDAVRWAYENEIVAGTTATTFSPNAPVTRAQVVTFLWRAAGCPVVNYYMSMDDVKSGQYYTEAVRWALSEGITMGTTDTTFSPNAVCTREQIVAFLYRYAKAPAISNMTANGPAPSPFSDVPNTSYSYNAVMWASKNGVTSGTTDTTFSPKAECTRAQVVTFLYRWMVK